jgi:EmrB/QacA subfamily drug resistance transporter
VTIRPTRHRQGWLLATLLGGMFLGNVDLAIVNIAAPSIRDDLQVSDGALELIVSGYTLAYAMLLITSAWLGETRGYRGMFRLGLVVFTLSSLACGLAGNAAMLVCARIVQGAGAALMAAQVLTGIRLDIDESVRGRALGLYSVVLAGSAVIGQALGGVLVTSDLFGAGWRPIFLINVPIGVGLALAGALVPPTDRTVRRQRLDLVGVATLSSALLLLVLPFVLGRDEGWPAWTLACLVACVPSFALFVIVERRVAARGGDPLVDLELLRRPPVVCALASQAATRATYLGLLFVLALYLQQGLGRSPTYSGLAVVPWVAAFGVAGPVLGRAGPRARRMAAPIGSVVLAAGFLAIAAGPTPGAGDGTLLMVLLAVGGLGYGAAFSGTLGHLTSTVADRHAADMSGLFNTTLQVGGAIGVAAFGTLYLDLAPQPGHLPALHASGHAFGMTTLAMAATALLAGVLAHVAVRERSLASYGSRTS